MTRIFPLHQQSMLLYQSRVRCCFPAKNSISLPNWTWWPRWDSSDLGLVILICWCCSSVYFSASSSHHLLSAPFWLVWPVRSLHFTPNVHVCIGLLGALDHSLSEGNIGWAQLEYKLTLIKLCHHFFSFRPVVITFGKFLPNSFFVMPNRDSGSF